jgi:hypothetical protein
MQEPTASPVARSHRSRSRARKCTRYVMRAPTSTASGFRRSWSRRQLTVEPSAAQSGPQRNRSVGLALVDAHHDRGHTERLPSATIAPVQDVDLSSPEESGAPITGTPPLVHKPILWTNTAINPSKPHAKRARGAWSRSPNLQQIATFLIHGAIASHARGRWFEPSRAHLKRPCKWGLFACATIAFLGAVPLPPRLVAGPSDRRDRGAVRARRSAVGALARSVTGDSCSRRC